MTFPLLEQAIQLSEAMLLGYLQRQAPHLAAPADGGPAASCPSQPRELGPSPVTSGLEPQVLPFTTPPSTSSTQSIPYTVPAILAPPGATECSLVAHALWRLVAVRRTFHELQTLIPNTDHDQADHEAALQIADRLGDLLDRRDDEIRELRAELRIARNPRPSPATPDPTDPTDPTDPAPPSGSRHASSSPSLEPHRSHPPCLSPRPNSPPALSLSP